MDSRPGHTAFSVLIPEHTGAYEVLDMPVDNLARGSGHLLFVEDDPDQIETIPRVLESIGYTVSATHSAAIALSLVDRDPHGFDAVITDFDMPVMNGIELARMLATKMPGVPVIIVSGRERAVEQVVPVDNVRRIVLKPYDRSTIAQVLQEVLKKDE